MNQDFIRRTLLADQPGATLELVDRAIVSARDILANLVHYQSDKAHYDEDVAALARQQLHHLTVEQLTAPFVRFIDRFDAHPLSKVDDAFYGIHGGENEHSPNGAELRLSDLRRLRDAVRDRLQPAADQRCELCDDVSASLFLRARCHPTAPLKVRKEGSILVLSCYLPECDREVVRLELAK